MGINPGFIKGPSLLNGDATVPGVPMPKELGDLLPTIFKEVRDLGCDFFPTIVEKVNYSDMSEIAAYGGFPIRYPHWKWGMEYEELQKGYENFQHRIYEMVINTDPCIIYCMDSNTLVDDVTVVAHALGHNDFFKNNIYFSRTNRNMLNGFANNGARITKYIRRWGKETVTEFIDHVGRIETLIDPSNAWLKKKIKNPIIRDSREYKHPQRLKIRDDHDYMEEYINPDDWIKKQQKKIDTLEIAANIGAFFQPTKDVMRFLRDYAPLKPWQADILSILYEEAMYFAPQRMTKMLNEGFASWVDYKIMAERGFAALGQPHVSSGIVEYAAHKMGVLGGKYSSNPYKLGYSLLSHIEERWNKGQFGSEWDSLDSMEERRKWDKGLGKGHEKVFEVRKYYNDLTAIMEFFTEDFCEKYEFFDYKRYPNGEYKIESRDHKAIKKKLIKKYTNGGLPEIKLVDANHCGKGYLFLQHTWIGQTLYQPYVMATLESLQYLWKNNVYLCSKASDDKEIVYYCTGPEKTGVVSREDYIKRMDSF